MRVLVLLGLPLMLGSRTPLFGQDYIRGDCNADSTTNSADAAYLLNALFLGGPGFSCEDACDANADSAIGLSDVVFLLSHRFLDGPVPSAPYPSCGNVPSLGCASHPCSGGTAPTSPTGFSLDLGDASITGLTSATVEVLLSSATNSVEGFTLAIGYDTSLLSATDLDIAGATVAAGAEFVVPEIFEASGGCTLGVLLDLSPPFDGQTISPGSDQQIAQLTLQPDLIVGSSMPTVVQFIDGVFDDPVLSNIVISAGLSAGAADGVVLTGGTVTLDPPPPVTFLLAGDSIPFGGTGVATVRMDNAVEVEAYVLAITHDPSELILDSIDITGTSAEAVGAEFVSGSLFPSGGSLEVILDFDPPFAGQMIAPGASNPIANFHYGCVDSPILGTPDLVSPIQFEDGVLGSPPEDNVVTIATGPISPTLGGAAEMICAAGCSPVVDPPDDTVGDFTFRVETVAVAYTSYVPIRISIAEDPGHPGYPNLVDAFTLRWGSMADDCRSLWTFIPPYPLPYLQAANGGAGPDYFDVLMDSDSAMAVWVVYVIVDSSGLSGLTFPTMQEVIALYYFPSFHGSLSGSTVEFPLELSTEPGPLANSLSVGGVAQSVGLDHGLLSLTPPISPPVPPDFVRGDTDANGVIGAPEVIFLLNYLYLFAQQPPSESGDANDDERVDLADAAYLTRFLGGAGPAPPAPYPVAGGDPTPGGTPPVTDPGLIFSISFPQAVPGDTFEFEFRATTPEPIDGFSLALGYDCWLQGLYVNFSNTAIDSVGIEFFNYNIDNDPNDGDGCELVVGSLVEALYPFEVRQIPVLADGVLFRAEFSVSELARPDIELLIEHVDGLNGAGLVPIDNLVIVDGLPRRPGTRLPGAVLTIPEPEFLRGDADGNGLVEGMTGGTDLDNDIVAALAFLFESGTAPIDDVPGAPNFDILDANDDGRADPTDIVFLNHFFAGTGSAPPLPYPISGTDPTDDPLASALSSFPPDPEPAVTIRAPHLEACPGETFPLPFSYSTSIEVHAVTVAIQFDPWVLQMTGLSIAGSPLESVGVEYAQHSIDNNALDGDPGELVVAIILDLFAPYAGQTAPLGTDQLLFTVDAGAASGLTGVETSTLTFVTADGAAAQPVRNLVTVTDAGIGFLDSRTPVLLDGSVTVTPGRTEPAFLPGDGNGDGALDIGDAVAILQYLFLDGAAPCLASLDAFEDGAVSISDALLVVCWLFNCGPGSPSIPELCAPVTGHPLGCASPDPGCECAP